MAITTIHPVKGANGTSGASPTNGANGTDAIFTQNGKIGADALIVQATGGEGGDGGTGTGGAAGANGGKGGNAAITLNGNIFNAPATTSLVVSLTAAGGDGGQAGPGTPAGSLGAGGNGTVTVNGNIIQPNKAMANIELDAIAQGGNGSKKGNASATLNGNIVQPSKGATSVILKAQASNLSDNSSHDGDPNFGTKTATLNGNIVQGSISSFVTLQADATPSNGTANINGNIVQTNAANTGLVTLEASGNHISVTNNKVTLGLQEFDFTINSYTPYDTTIKDNTFTGTGNNTFVFTDNALPGPHSDTVTVNLANNTFVFDGLNNALTGFNSASVLGTGDPATLIGNDNANTLTGGDGIETLIGGKGNDILDGGNGASDVAVYSGPHTDYTYSFIHTGNLAGTVTDNVANRDGSDTVQNVEFIQFSDGTYNTITNIFTPTVPTNTAPVLDASKTPVLATETEDPGAPGIGSGTLVSSLVDYASPAGQVDNVTDPDGPGLGIALTGADTANGSWLYSTDGGTTWNAVGAVTNSSALLLDGSARLFFQPNLNYNGTDTGAITFRAWDESSGSNGGTADTTINGGSTAFSTATDTADIAITAVNDAPVATITPASYSAIEQTVLSLKNNGLAISDVDAGAGSVTATLSVTEGTLNVTAGTSGANVAGSGTGTVTLTGTLGQINALLNTDGASTVSYIDNTDTPSASATLNLSVNDGGNTGSGGPLTGSDTATINITPVNDAPVLDNTKSPVLAPEAQNPGAPGIGSGTLVSSLVDYASPAGQVDNVTDPDGPGLGIALTGTDTANGSWLYSTNGGTTWNAVGAVTNSSALLLDGSARLFFQPNLNYSGTDTGAITFRAWDESGGSNGGTADTTINGGSAAFSSAFDTASLTVIPNNTAPVLDNTKTPVLATEGENGGAPAGMVGTLVSSLVNLNPPLGGLDNVTDADPSPQTGIALTGTDTANGSWFYSTDNGATWNAVGAVSNSSALLLAGDANTRLYFQPSTNFSGTDSSAITFRAWDQSSGTNGATANTTVNGGSTAFSTATDTADITIDPVRIGNNFYATINDALAAATDGDTIFVQPGEYDESLVITKEVNIVGVGAPGSVVIKGTFLTDQTGGTIPDGGVATWLKGRPNVGPNPHGYTGDTGITVNADNVGLTNLTVEDFQTNIGTQNNAERLANTVNSVSNLALTDVNMLSGVTGFLKDDGTTLNGLTITGGNIGDGLFGVYLANDVPTAGDATGTTIQGVNFGGANGDILEKGIYAETLQGNTLIDGNTLTNVGNYGGVQTNGADGLNGNGIDVNLKFHTYVGDLDITNNTLLNTGNSSGASAHPGGQNGAIVIEGRDDPGHPVYGVNPADVSGLNVTISGGSIDGSPSGVRIGELAKPDSAHNVTGPAVTIDGTVIVNTTEAEIENHSHSLMTVIGTSGNDTYRSDQTAVSTGPIKLMGLAGDDYLAGGQGDDILQGGVGDDALDGGTAGNDTADYSDATSDGLVVDLAAGTSSGGFGLASNNDTLFNIDNLTGSSFNDTLTGDTNDNVLKGGAGDDTLDGGGGTDTADYSDATSDGLIVNLMGSASSGGGLGNDTLFNIQNVVGSDHNDTLIGDDGDNTLVGGDGNDILYGHGGNNTLAGGDGVNVAYYSGLESDPTYSITGTLLVSGGPDDVSDFLSQVQRLKFLSPSHVSDVDNDGAADLVYQNGNSIEVGGNVLNPVGPGNPVLPASFTVVGTGQFNPDVNRNSDILVQDTSNGHLQLLQDISGANPGSSVDFSGAALTGANYNVNWKAIATGDFNGDASWDVLLQNQVNKTVEIFTVDANLGETAGQVSAVTSVAAPSGSNWNPIAAGDFNGDGKSDILWQNSANKAVEITLEGATPTNTPALGTTNLTAVATGDFNGDGFSDILFKNTTGQAVVWFMNGGAHTGTKTVTHGMTPGVNWTVSGAADVDGNGYSDIIWTDPSAVPNGAASASLMSGSAANPTVSTINLAAPGSNFHLIATGGG